MLPQYKRNSSLSPYKINTGLSVYNINTGLSPSTYRCVSCSHCCIRPSRPPQFSPLQRVTTHHTALRQPRMHVTCRHTRPPTCKNRATSNIRPVKECLLRFCVAVCKFNLCLLQFIHVSKKQTSPPTAKNTIARKA